MTARVTLSIIALSLAVTACSIPVHGSFGNGKEKFIGQATNVFGGGNLNIQTDRGTQCEGKFQYSGLDVLGNGDFDCDDGRKGNFTFTRNRPSSGQGIGKTTEGEPFKFLYGAPDMTVQAW